MLSLPGCLGPVFWDAVLSAGSVRLWVGVGCDRSCADLLCGRPLCLPCCRPGWVGCWGRVPLFSTSWGYCAGDGLGGKGVG